MGTNFNILSLYENNSTNNINDVEKNRFLNSLNDKNTLCNITDNFISYDYTMNNDYSMCFVNYNTQNINSYTNFNTELVNELYQVYNFNNKTADYPLVYVYFRCVHYDGTIKRFNLSLTDTDIQLIHSFLLNGSLKEFTLSYTFLNSYLINEDHNTDNYIMYSYTNLMYKLLDNYSNNDLKNLLYKVSDLDLYIILNNFKNCNYKLVNIQKYNNLFTSSIDYDLTYKGKVRDVYRLNNSTLLIDTTDRVSAFDSVVGVVNGKGVLLNEISSYMFEKTRHLVPNHYITSYKNYMFVREARPIKLEVIVRGYITGSLWKLYTEKGADYVNDLYGINLPNNLEKNSKLSVPIVTPTTKDEHDDPINWKDFTNPSNSKYIMSLTDWQILSNYALTLFNHATNLMDSVGIIFVDSKYEFGRNKEDNSIMLIDELHTPDSSRFWNKESWVNDRNTVKCYDKQFFRDWLKTVDKNNVSDSVTIPESISTQLVSLYRFILDKVTTQTQTQTQKTFTTPFDVSLNQYIQEYYNYYSDKIVFILAGSTSDSEWVHKISNEVRKFGYDTMSIFGSAHKETGKVMKVLNDINTLSPKNRKVAFVTVAGRSNALSGVVSCNTHYPVIACPPFKDKSDMMVNINSTLQMPSKVPAMTILEPLNVAISIDRIFKL